MAQHQAQPHSWGAMKLIPWPVCKGCGLLKLHNPLTDWCVRNGCNHEEHQGYKSAVATLSKPENLHCQTK